MKVFFHGWFGGFIDKTNPGLNYEFFINLFNKVYNETCEIGTLEDSDILCEYMAIYSNTHVMHSESALNKKKWKHTYCFSGESWTNKLKDKYDCVLWGERNHKNVVNVPLFIPYIYTNNFIERLQTKIRCDNVPSKDVCVVVSNPNGPVRNKFLERLEKRCKVTYMGRYKNNVGQLLPFDYNDERFISLISKFKFIVSMENSENDTYITEKVLHGLLGNTIPVYWGSKRIYDYINKERILCLENDNNNTIDDLINKMLNIKNNPKQWLDIVNKPNFPKNNTNNVNDNNLLERTNDVIAKDIRSLLNKNTCWKTVSKIFCICKQEYEPDRFKDLQNMFSSQNINLDHVSFICPTYKHTIDDATFHKYTKNQKVLTMRKEPMNKGQLSLIINYRETLREIEKNYSDGKFFIFESDALISKDIAQLNDFLTSIKDKKWNSIHLGMYQDNIFDYPITNWITGLRGYNDKLNSKLNNHLNKNCKIQKFIEDITTPKDKYRLIRKYHTRCCDSIIWDYNGACRYLEWLDKNIDYSVPNDYVMINFFENNIDISHYWSINEFFKQGSNLGLVERAY